MTQLTFDPPTTEPMTAGGRVDAVDVCRIVGTRQILQEVSLSIEPGELVAIAGGSGAGKTTLLEILAGLQPPSAGQVRHNGVVAAPGSMPIPGSATCPRTTSSTSKCPCAAHCATPRGYGCPQ